MSDNKNLLLLNIGITDSKDKYVASFGNNPNITYVVFLFCELDVPVSWVK